MQTWKSRRWLFNIWIFFDKYMPRVVSPYPECHMVVIWSKFWLIIQKMIKDNCYFFNLISLLLIICYVKTCLESLQELSYLNFTWLKLKTDKILTGTFNFWKCTFLKFCLSTMGWIWKFYLPFMCYMESTLWNRFKWKNDKIFTW